MAYIDDDELRDIFRDESQEHLATLESCLLRLEAQPNDHDSLDEALREAHSLKGAARMLGVHGVERVAHRYEDVLREAFDGNLALSPAVVDQLAAGLDALTQLVREAVTGDRVAFQVADVLARLDSAAAKPAAKPEPAPVPVPVPVPEPDPEPAEPPPVADNQPYRIDTIRVDTRRLDSLLAQTGELQVASLRLQRRLAQSERLLDQTDRLARRLRAAAGPGEAGLKLLDQLCDEAARLRQDLFDDAATLEGLADVLGDGTRRLRLLPLSTVFQQFQRPIRDTARQLGKEVRLVLEGGETTADKQLIEEIKDVLMHLLRNAVDHGLEMPRERAARGKPAAGEIRLRGSRTATEVMIEVSDDGKGLDVERIRRQALKQRLASAEELKAMPPAALYQLIFRPGFSTAEIVTDLSGRGVGMDVVRSRVEALKGSVRIESEPGRGCRIVLGFPAALSTRQVFLVRAAGQVFAVPVEQVRLVRALGPTALFRMDDRETVVIDGQAVAVARLADVLALDHRGPSPMTCLVLTDGEDQVALLVEEILDELEVILKAPGLLLKRVRNVSGVCVLASGDVCVVLNPVDLIRSAIKHAAPPPAVAEEAAGQGPHQAPVILLAEDSVTTRTQEKRILESAGYEVVTAVDGLAALGLLASRRFDALVSDIEMPNMDGLTLTARLRQIAHCKDMPVVLVTSLSRDEDKRRGLEAGANAYLTKSAFNQQLLLDTLGRLI